MKQRMPNRDASFYKRKLLFITFFRTFLSEVQFQVRCGHWSILTTQVTWTENAM